VYRSKNHVAATLADMSHISGGRCTLRNAEFRKSVFCGIKIAENVLVVELYQLIKCTILQSTQPPCSQALLHLAGGDSRLILISFF